MKELTETIHKISILNGKQNLIKISSDLWKERKETEQEIRSIKEGFEEWLFIGGAICIESDALPHNTILVETFIEGNQFTVMYTLKK